MLSRFACTTDDAEVAKIVNAMQCPLIERPKELAGDATPMKLVIEHALTALESAEGYRPDFAVLLQPTSPLRSSRDIDCAIEALLESDADSVVSVTAVPGHYHADWQFKLNGDNSLALWNGENLGKMITRRQDLSPSYTRNGAVYAFRVDRFLKSGSIYGTRCLGYIMNAEDSINIDDEIDFSLAEQRIAELRNATEVEVNH